jgi:hypothetical protein
MPANGADALKTLSLTFARTFLLAPSLTLPRFARFF